MTNNPSGRHLASTSKSFAEPASLRAAFAAFVAALGGEEKVLVPFVAAVPVAGCRCSERCTTTWIDSRLCLITERSPTELKAGYGLQLCHFSSRKSSSIDGRRTFHPLLPTAIEGSPRPTRSPCRMLILLVAKRCSRLDCSFADTRQNGLSLLDVPEQHLRSPIRRPSRLHPHWQSDTFCLQPSTSMGQMLVLGQSSNGRGQRLSSRPSLVHTLMRSSHLQ